jgi:RNA polymerase sigma factor (TIGR02999 family)
MTPPAAGEVTRLLEAAQGGDAQARERLFQVLSREIRGLAERSLQRDCLGHAWRPSDLIQEVMVRLVTGKVLDRAPNRAYLFGAAARAMRCVLVDFLRKPRPPGGGVGPLADAAVLLHRNNGIDLLALHEALERLEALHARQRQVVDEYHFGGYTMREIAEHLGVSEGTVSKDFERAKQWLRAQLEEPTDDARAV